MNWIRANLIFIYILFYQTKYLAVCYHWWLDTLWEAEIGDDGLFGKIQGIKVDEQRHMYYWLLSLNLQWESEVKGNTAGGCKHLFACLFVFVFLTHVYLSFPCRWCWSRWASSPNWKEKGILLWFGYKMSSQDPVWVLLLAGCRIHGKWCLVRSGSWGRVRSFRFLGCLYFLYRLGFLVYPDMSEQPWVPAAVAMRTSPTVLSLP